MALYGDPALALQLAAIGPATEVIEVGAAAVGSGMVLGGFFAGVVSGLALLRRGADLERSVVMLSYVGGLLGLLALMYDWMRW